MCSQLKEDIQDREVLEFVIFCIENIAIKIGVSGEIVYAALTEKSNILKNYIVPCYEVLHTQGKEYIVDDIMRVMEKEGVKV
jgi:hypothetical protein